MKKQAEEREFMLQENLRTENLLARSMACLKTIHQLYHYHKHTTKEQDNEYEVSHSLQSSGATWKTGLHVSEVYLFVLDTFVCKTRGSLLDCAVNKTTLRKLP